MPKIGYYVPGDWNAQCDECGRGFKFSQLNIRWDGQWCCSACWEIRQPQDFVRGIKDDQSIPVARPRLFQFVSTGTDPFEPLGEGLLGEELLGE